MHSVDTHDECFKMKVKSPRRNSNTNNGFAPPPIPLERPAAKELGKDQYLALKLKSVPGRATSGEYTLNVPYFKTGETEEWFKFLQNLDNVFTQQNVLKKIKKITWVLKEVPSSSKIGAPL